MSLNNGYEPSTLLFQKYDNKKCNKRGRTEYFSSMFLGLESGRSPKLAEYKGMLFDDDLVFDSNYQSANLMAVFKVILYLLRWVLMCTIWCYRTILIQRDLLSGLTSRFKIKKLTSLLSLTLLTLYFFGYLVQKEISLQHWHETNCPIIAQ